MKYKTEIVIEAIRLKEAGVTTSAISKKLLAPSSTINEWLKKAKQNNLTAENLRSLSEQDIEEILRPRSWSRQNVILPDYEDLTCKGLGSENDSPERLLAISGFSSRRLRAC